MGQRDLMEAASHTWISSTLASESTALAAAGAVLDWHEKADICRLACRDRAGAARVDECGDQGEWRTAGVTVEMASTTCGSFGSIHAGSRITGFSSWPRGRRCSSSEAHTTIPRSRTTNDIIQRIEAAANAAFIELRDAGRVERGEGRG